MAVGNEKHLARACAPWRALLAILTEVRRWCWALVARAGCMQMRNAQSSSDLAPGLLGWGRGTVADAGRTETLGGTRSFGISL